MARLADFIGETEEGDFRVLDLGGQPEYWSYIDCSLDIVILNLPGVARHNVVKRHTIQFVEGDACDLSRYADKEFDLVFSNSVIEHVGGNDKVASFCEEAIRVGKKVWIQTPSKYFPLEPHTGMPFWWYWPDWLKKYVVGKWRAELPAWTEMVEGTRYISKEHLLGLLPNCRVITERFVGLPKSYIVTTVTQCC